MRELLRVVEAPRRCSYLPDEVASLEYRIIPELDVPTYAEMLARGYRRFGIQYFRPACRACTRCRSIRLKVQDFVETRRWRRVMKLNADVEVTVRTPELSTAHLRLYRRYHRFMQSHRQWPTHDSSPQSYAQTFLIGGDGFAREICYHRKGELIGCALMDDVGSATSLVYFYYAPEWRPSSPGAFSILTQIRYAREHRHEYVYLGYWISENRSMSYKSQYQPHELLASYPRDGEQPRWCVPPGATLAPAPAMG